MKTAAVARALRIGLISDTHGLLRPEALASLQCCDHIVHGGDIVIHVLHEFSRLDFDPTTERVQGVWYVNPGSAGRRRFKLPVAVGELILERGVVAGRAVELEASGRPPGMRAGSGAKGSSRKGS